MNGVSLKVGNFVFAGYYTLHFYKACFAGY